MKIVVMGESRACGYGGQGGAEVRSTATPPLAESDINEEKNLQLY